MASQKPLIEVIVSEVALDGFEGITFIDLCQRISKRQSLSNPLPTKIRDTIWSFVLRYPEFRFYILPTPRQILTIYDRATLDALSHTKIEKDQATGVVKYKYNPLDIEGERGSCEHYDTRVEIQASELAEMTVDVMVERYGQALVIVASQKQRNKVLGLLNDDLNLQQYCILERIGRSRELGEFSAGPGTLQDILNTEKKVAGGYVMKRLISRNLITKQEYRLERENITKFIYHLPQFYSEMKSRVHLLMENAINFLKNCPNGMGEIREVRAALMCDPNQAIRAMKHPDFREVTVREDLPYRQVYPDAPREKWQCKNHTERLLNMIRLKDPSIEVYNLFTRKTTNDVSEQNEDEDGRQLMDVGNQIHDLSLLRQLYRYLDEKGVEGAKQIDVQRFFGLSRLNGRAIMRVFERHALTDTFMVDEGRQRVKKWYLKKYKEQRDAMKNCPEILPVPQSQENSSQNSISTTETKPQENEDEVLLNVTDNIVGFESSGVDTSSVDATLTFMKVCPGMKLEAPGIRSLLSAKNLTHRVLRRCQVILKLLGLRKVVSSTILNMAIRASETRWGYTDQCDKKSCMRLLNRLAADDYLNIMELRMTIKDKEITYLFAVALNLEPDSEEVRVVVDSYKAKQIMKRVYEEEGVKEEKKLARSNNEGLTLDKEAKKGLQEFTMAPKFIRMRNLHEFLFYFMYGQNPEKAQPLDASQVVKGWHGIHPDTDFNALDLPPIYSKELDWRTFVAPNKGERAGWGILGEIVLKMPLSLVFTLINFDLRHPELQQMLLHPVKRFYTVAQAPQSIRAVLTYHRLYSYSIYSNAVNLAYIGALQFGMRRSPEKDQVYIYVNRNVSVFDTRSSEPSYHKVEEDKEYPQRVFYLKTLDDLEKYWSDIYVIAHGTKLNHRLASAGQEVLIEQPSAKAELQRCTEARSWEEAVNLDDGSIPGDHLGAAGFDSALFTHIKQNWMKGRSSKSVNTKLLLSAGKKKRSIHKYNQVSAAEAASKRKAMIALRKVGSIKRRGIKSESKLRRIPLKMNQGKRIRMPHYDEVDKTALKLMNKLRVDWKEEEDQTLLTCKLALLYMSPPVGCGASFQAIRDILHFKHASSINKTTKACQRRLMYILKLNTDTRSMLNFDVEELKQNRDIEKRFGENFLQNLRQVFPSEQDFNVAMKIHFVTLIYLLDNCYKNLATNQFQFKNIVLPDTIEEFQEQFNMSRINKLLYVQDPTTVEGVQTMMVDAVIHSSMCCTKDKTTWNFQLFDIYKNYSDELLRTSIKELRARSVISANKSVMTKRLFTSPVSGCPFHLSQTYLNQITTKFSYDSFSEAFARLLDMSDVISRGFYNFKSFDIGSTLLFADLCNRNLMTVNIELPKFVMQVEKNLPVENSASYERAKNKFYGILEHFQMNDEGKMRSEDSDEENLDTKIEEKEQKRRLDFKETEIYNYAQSPVEKLLKLDNIYFHFFCLLKSLKQKSPLMSQNFHAEEKCSLSECILSEADPIDACIRIAAQCKDIIKGLLSAQKKGNSAKIESNTKNYQIREENLQNFFENFTQNHRSQEKSKLLKIIGKEKVANKGPNMLELANDLNLQAETKLHFWIKLIDNTSKAKLRDHTAEFASSQSIVSAKKSKKDVPQDNVHRYHDLFNVNIGKLAVGVKNDASKVMVDFENVQTPECLMLLKKERKEDVVKKIKSSAIWPIHIRNITELRKTLRTHKLVDHERKLAENVLEQIKDGGEVGVKATSLAIIFQKTPHDLLQKVINALVAADFVLRTGIRTITYVHWSCANAWLVKSYNLKRLERESLPLESLTNSFPSTSEASNAAGKRLRDDDDEFLEGPHLKRHRGDYPEAEHVSDFVDRENIFLIPMPWIRINGTLNRRTLDKWMGTVLLHVLQFPGQYLKDIFNRFSILTPVQVRKLLEFLVDLDCLSLHVKMGPKVNLFSDFETNDFTIRDATDFDSEHEVFAQCKPEAFTKFAFFIGNKKYSSDFI